jgi:hypothetical protein
LRIQVEPYDCDVIAGNQQRISVLGKVIVPVTIVECQYQIVCIVVAVLSHELILGWDGLPNIKALLTLKQIFYVYYDLLYLKTTFYIWKIH